MTDAFRPSAATVVRADQIIDQLIRTSKNVPDDVLALIARILIDENATRIPAVHFRHSKKYYSTGRCYKDHIVYTMAPTIPAKYKPILIVHEVTHWLTPGEHHSPFFYEKLFELCERYKCDMEYALETETRYKSSAAPMGYALYMRAQKGIRWKYDTGDKS